MQKLPVPVEQVGNLGKGHVKVKDKNKVNDFGQRLWRAKYQPGPSGGSQQCSNIGKGSLPQPCKFELKEVFVDSNTMALPGRQVI